MAQVNDILLFPANSTNFTYFTTSDGQTFNFDLSNSLNTGYYFRFPIPDKGTYSIEKEKRGLGFFYSISIKFGIINPLANNCTDIQDDDAPANQDVLENVFFKNNSNFFAIWNDSGVWYHSNNVMAISSTPVTFENRSRTIVTLSCKESNKNIINATLIYNANLFGLINLPYQNQNQNQNEN